MEEQETSKEFKKRSVAFNKKISEVSKDDSRVALVGTVIDVDEKNFVFTLDDSSKKINVILLDEQLIHKAKIGKILRVIGVIIAGDSGIELKGELVQDFTGLNVEYYNKYLELANA
ncbi:MAG: replication protein RepA [Candidatus Nanoarchaeia archaeon]|nr:replication protein RepA [Candidatus Nanoarchaeia archaeon]